MNKEKLYRERFRRLGKKRCEKLMLARIRAIKAGEIQYTKHWWKDAVLA